jgi:hypothetical protein
VNPTRPTTVLSLFAAFVLAIALPSFLPAQAPIKLDPRNPHYFRYQGKTIALVSSGEHYGAVLNLDIDYHRYLVTLQSEGLNYTRIFGGSYVEVPGKSFGIKRNDLAPESGRFLAPWKRSDTPGYAGGGNKFDLAQWNPEYFERLHSFLAEAQSRGIIVELTFFSSQYGEVQWAYSPFNPNNNVNHTIDTGYQLANTLNNGSILSFQEAYTRKLVREAAAYSNVIFEIANEPWSDRPVITTTVNPYLFPQSRLQFPNTVDLPDDQAMAWEVRAGSWIVSEQANLPQKHLIAQNYCDFGFPVRELIPGVSIVNFHYAYPEAVTANYGLDKAIAYDETGFLLGEPDTAYLRQAWNFMLSGGGTFGALDYSFTAHHEDGTDTAPNGPGGGSPALRKQLGILKHFLEWFSLPDLSPDINIVKHAPGSYVHALSGGSQYAIYLDGASPQGGEITLFTPVGHYSGQWLDPVTGETTEVKSFGGPGGIRTLKVPPFQNGMALRLSRYDQRN